MEKDYYHTDHDEKEQGEGSSHRGVSWKWLRNQNPPIPLFRGPQKSFALFIAFPYRSEMI